MSVARFDVCVIGAGAAGLMAAAGAAKRWRRVVLLEHTRTIGAKILISGGGRCNFTNLDVRPDRFLSDNPHFAKSALARYTQHDFIALVKKHGVPFYEKTLGQLFCEGVGSAQRIVDLLVAEAAGVEIRTGVSIGEIARGDAGFALTSAGGDYLCDSLILATGGLSIPKLGATDFAFRVAERFGLPVVAPRPALTPLTFGAADLAWMAPLSGVSADAITQCGKAAFREGLLFTHRGLSGPSILQISSYRRAAEAISVNFTPAHRMADLLKAHKRERPKQKLATALSAVLPERLAQALSGQLAAPEALAAPLSDWRDRDLESAGAQLNAWAFQPTGDEGYAKAEVTAGGVDTRALSSKTMAARDVPGLYVIGEAVDVTGWLGGYNFQWAWSSGWAAGQDA
jgi:hypothetical protein